MKQLFVFCLWILAGSAFSAEPKLKGQPFRPGDCEIAWAAPTNALPTNAWIYKVVPSDFSQSMISNLLSICRFSEKDKKRVPRDYPVKDKGLLHYQTKDDARYLNIVPSSGFIEYYDSHAKAEMTESVDGVPSEDEALSLTLTNLLRLGIDRSQFMTKTNSSELRVFRTQGERGKIDKKNGEKLTKDIDSRGVMLVRQVDGIPFIGIGASGGVKATYGNNGKLAQLDINWRNLERVKSFTVPSSERLVQIIKKGNAVLPPQRTPSITQLRKLTVTKISLHYWGTPGDEPQTMLYPFAALEASAEAGDVLTNVQLHCPIYVNE